MAVRRINNNVVFCRDGNGRELIALGKGIGFGEMPRELSLSQIERTFYDVDDRYQPLLVELPPAVLAFTAGLLDIARNELSYELSPNTVFTLADHINFAMERARKQLRVRMPLTYDVKLSYPKECRIGRYAVKRILKEFHIALPREEEVGIALNLVNAKLTPESPAEQSRSQDCAEMLEDITELVEEFFKIIIDRDSFNYSRYATHLQYLFDRIRDHKEISSDNLQMYKSLREEFPQVAACVERIADHIRQVWGSELSEEEKLYLILHVNRICIKEGL